MTIKRLSEKLVRSRTALKLEWGNNLRMQSSSQIPPGPLGSIERSWDYKGGWVRAPLQQIVCNNSLSKQARLLWLWLASVKPGDRSYTWGDCEAALGCQTKARKNCIAQLISHGFVEIKPDGTVILKDPYEAYENNNLSSDSIIVTENELKSDSYPEPIATAKAGNVVTQKAKDKVTPKTRNPDVQEYGPSIIQAWNKHKPKSYQKLRSISIKQWEAFSKQLKNLNKKSTDIDSFIQTVCNGIEKSDFWSNKVQQSGRNFSSIFGYGNAQDTKLRNVEQLYEIGSNVEISQQDSSSSLDHEDISAYKTVKYNLQNARMRGDIDEIKRWSDFLVAVEYRLVSSGANLDDI